MLRSFSFSSSQQQKRLLLWLALLLTTGFFLWAFLLPWFHYALDLIPYPFDWDPYEGFVLPAVHALRSESLDIYRDPLLKPYTTYAYPPLYPFLIWILSPAVSLQEPTSLLFLARMVSLGSFFFTIVLGVWAVHTLTKSLLFSLAFPILFMSVYDAAVWSPLARVDYPAIVFTLLSLVLWMKDENKPEKPGLSIRVICAAIFLIFAVLTKHSALPLAVFLFLFWTIRRRYRIEGCIGLLLLFAMALLGAHTENHFFSSMVGSSWKDMDLSRAWSFSSTTFLEYPILFFFGPIALTKHVVEKGLWHPLVIFTVYSSGFFLIAGHSGSALNYTILPAIFFSIFILYGLQQILSNHRFSRNLLLILVLLLHLSFSWRHFDHNSPDQADLGRGREVVAFLSFFDQPPLTDEYPMFTYHAGHAPLIDLESTKGRLMRKFPKPIAMKKLKDILLGLNSPAIFAGMRLASFYPDLMSGYKAAGKISIGTWFGEEEFAAFVRSDHLPKVQQHCLQGRHRNLFFCQAFQFSKNR